MLSPFTLLSEELVDTIISHIPASGDLCNLALTSRQLHRITTPHLYGNIKLTLKKDEKSYKRLHCLVETLLDSSKLAGIVRHLTIRNKWVFARERQESRGPGGLHTVFIQKILSLMHKTKDRHPWMNKSAGWESREALIVVLLYLVPNLRSLDTNMPDEIGDYWEWLMNQLMSHKALINLEELVIVDPTREKTSHRSFLHLPRLKSAYFYKLFELSDDGPPVFEDEVEHSKEAYRQYLANASDAISIHRGRFAPVNLHAIEHLEIRLANLDFGSLLQIIGNCAALRTFAFDFDDSVFGEHPCFYNAVVQALSLHAETLTALYIGDSPDGENPHDRRVEYAILPNFHKLVNLKYLKIPVTGVFPAPPYGTGSISTEYELRRLPPSLEKLAVILNPGIEAGLLPEFNRYLESSTLPNLRVVELHTLEPEAVYSYVQKPADQSNVQLRIFRRLYTARDNYSLTPLATSLNRGPRGILDVQVDPKFPISEDLRLLFMPVEEFTPMDEIVVTSF